MSANPRVTTDGAVANELAAAEVSTGDRSAHRLDGKPLTLLLSGGGFRATLFHLGVIRYLRESNRLKDVVELFSVSGGSIMAAHLALNWGDYTGNNAQFERAADELLNFTRWGLRERIVRSMLVFWLGLATTIIFAFSLLQFFFDYSTVTYLGTAAIAIVSVAAAIYLDRLFRPVKMLAHGYRKLLARNELRHLDSATPKLHCLATNLTTGNIACFVNNGIYPDLDGDRPRDELHFIPTSNCKLADCVAASSAFPPLFSPYELSPRSLKVDFTVLEQTQYLTDGGVFDNLGVRACRLLTQNHGGEVLVSDAERKFDKSVGAAYRWLVSRASRATDVLMHRVNELEFELLDVTQANVELLKKFDSVRFARLQIDHAPVVGSVAATLSPDLSRRVRRVRTDLDAFTDLEIQLLYAKGLLAAKHAFTDIADLGSGINLDINGIPTGATPDRWLPIKQLHTKSTDEIVNDLESSESVNWRKLLAWQSLTFWMIAALLGLILLVNPFSVSVIRSYQVLPVKLRSEKLIPAESELASEYTLLTAFLLEAVELQPTGKRVQFLFVESNSLGDAAGFFSPRKFTYQLAVPDNLSVFYKSSFLIYSPGNSLSSVGTVKGSLDTFEVIPRTRECKIVMLLGVAQAIDERDPIDAADIKFNIGG